MRVLLAVLIVAGGYIVVGSAVQMALIRAAPGLYYGLIWVNVAPPILGIGAGMLAARHFWRMTRR